jgi:excinuclease ABC subunit C
MQVFQVRSGRVIERIELGTEDAIVGSSEGEVLTAAIQQFYELRGAPAEIYVPAEPVDRDALETWLSDRAGRKVRIVVPQRGEKRGFVDLANRNAALAYQTRFNQAQAAQYDALETLQHVLALAALPRRIECFDISTIQGSETVASMVVCEDGRMRRGEYRKFRIRGSARPSAFAEAAADRRSATRGVWSAGSGRADTEGAGASEPSLVLSRSKHEHPSRVPSPRLQDDFAAMHEVVLRRYRKLLELGGPFPDLVLIDGGKGQLTAAYAALEELGLANLVAIGIAKKEELIYTREHDDAIALPTHDPALLLIQRIRDEAHRFAVTFHRKARSMRDLRSELDEVPGVGARRRNTLLRTFGSLAGVRRATREELAAAVGAKTADAVLAFFASRP